MVSFCRLRLPAALSALALLASAHAQTDVLTQHNDNARTGWYKSETKLNPSTVNVHTFGRILSRSIDGRCMSQILAVANVPIPNIGTRSCIYVTTVKNTVYCWDAINASATTPFWTRNFGPNVLSSLVSGGVQPEIGIVGTPVIDKAANALYVVAYTNVAGVITYHLHAIDIRTGADLPGSGLLIQGSVPGIGAGSVGGVVTFNPMKQLQRSALLLQNGKIIICFASHMDKDPYHGWVFEVDQATMAIDAIFCNTPNTSRGGIWMSGQGPSSDGTSIYFSSGNGPTKATSVVGYGDSVVKLLLDGHLTFQDSFAPFDSTTLDKYDLDFGSTGVLAIPGTNYVMCGSKSSILYILDRNNLGGYHPAGDTVYQEFKATPEHIHSAPIWWSTPAGSFAYIWGEDDVARQFQWQDNKFNTTPYATSTYKLLDGHMPGGMLSVSSNNTDPTTGIVWALHIDHALNPTAISTGPSVLRAFRADNIGVELWNSEMFGTLDAVGNFSKFTSPTIAFGRVYTPSSDGKIRVYGILGTKRAVLTLSNLAQVFDGTPKSVSVAIDPVGLAGLKVTYNGSTTAPTAVGSYAVVASLTTTGWTGPSVKGTLVISPPPAK